MIPFLPQKRNNSYLGRKYNTREIEILLKNKKIRYKTSKKIYDEVANYIAEGKINGMSTASLKLCES